MGVPRWNGRRLRSSARRLVGLAALLFAFVGCGAGDDEPSVFEELGLISTPVDGSDFVQEMLVENREVGDRVQVCMAEQGFEWTPFDSFELVAPTIIGLPRSGTPQYAQQAGYGILHNLPQALSTHPLAKPDPNQVYTDGLTRNEKLPYFQTLHGVNSGALGGRESTVDESLYRAGGCFGRARNELGISTEWGTVRGEMHATFEELEDRANADPRLLDYDREWSRCMALAGFRHASSVEARAYFDDVHWEIWGDAEFPAAAFSDDELIAMSTTDRAALYEQPPRIDEARWSEALALEIDTAVQDLQCQGDTPRRDIYQEVLADLEADFVAANQADIDQLLAAD